MGVSVRFSLEMLRDPMERGARIPHVSPSDRESPDDTPCRKMWCTRRHAAQGNAKSRLSVLISTVSPVEKTTSVGKITFMEKITLTEK